MTLSELVLNVLFYFFALLAVAGSLTVALSRNIVRTAFSLAGTLCAVAALYALAGAEFVFAVQVLVYVGGIVVLIVFAVMLTHKIADVRISNASAPAPVAFFVTLCLLYSLLLIIVSEVWSAPGTKAVTTRDIGGALMNEYLLPFEVVSVLLLAALVGAAYLARKEVKSEE